MKRLVPKYRHMTNSPTSKNTSNKGQIYENGMAFLRKVYGGLEWDSRIYSKR